MVGHVLKRVTIYCASSSKIDKVYLEAAERLAELLVKADIKVVFGGGANGLMGKIADTVVTNGGKITGIMPLFMKNVEWNHKKVTDFYFVEDLHQRKKKLIENADAVIALPGGCGTLEELLEVITLKRLGLYTNPIIILNTNGFYDHLESMLEKCISENFMSEVHRDIWNFVNEPEDVIDAINNAVKWDNYSIESAAVK